MNKQEITLSSQTIYSGKIVTLCCDQVALPNGKPAEREVVKHCGAIAVVPVLANGNIVMVRQYRYPVATELLELPAGKIDGRETPEACVRRELQEETGYIAGRIRKLAAIFTTPGFTDEVIHLYIAEDLTASEQCPDEDEFLEVEIYSPEEIKRLIAGGDIKDAKTLTGLFLAGLQC